MPEKMRMIAEKIKKKPQLRGIQLGK